MYSDSKWHVSSSDQCMMPKEIILSLLLFGPLCSYKLLLAIPSRKKIHRTCEEVVDATNCELTTIRQTPFLPHLVLGVFCGLLGF